MEPTIREPSDSEMIAARKPLTQWQTPEQFQAKVPSITRPIKSSSLLSHLNLQYNAGFRG
jgi:hypothetical protein